jgi:hypothetical protein
MLCTGQKFSKLGGGGGLAMSLSKLLNYLLHYFIGKSWPVTLGTGIGLGMGYANCQHTFYSQFPPHHRRCGPPWWQVVIFYI